MKHFGAEFKLDLREEKLCQVTVETPRKTTKRNCARRYTGYAYAPRMSTHSEIFLMLDLVTTF